MSDAANAGKNLRPPKDAQATENNQSDSDTTDMSTNQEATTPAESITDFGAMVTRHIQGHRFHVANLQEGTVAEVDIGEVTCTCEDMQYNNADRDVCKHLQKAMYDAPQVRQSMEVETFGSIMGLWQEARAAIDDIKDVRDVVQTGQTASAQAAVEQADDQPSSSGAEESGPSKEEVAEDAADRLQDAFDNVLDDMQVTAEAGHVWFQTGRETPDDWPFPGGDETFKVVSSPDVVKYVHDGSADWADAPHPLYEDKPGEWWKNALEPSDVDEYVAEVLE